ncbi:helix-turn-helix domain-containing protein [Microcoleus asticus]|uniref:helix-turn-helix domain-containing protein n=1 Tax=Microcoleus asticus TaxID=2815231 RepID=UPI001552D6D4
MSLEDQVLLALQYWREYRTYFHIAQSWNINESTAFRIVRHVEETFIRSGRFSLPGKKALLQPDSVLEVVVVDVTESPVERPKKNNDKCFPAKRSIIH